MKNKQQKYWLTEKISMQKKNLLLLSNEFILQMQKKLYLNDQF
jgi:hypothetical protein